MELIWAQNDRNLYSVILIFFCCFALFTIYLVVYFEHFDFQCKCRSFCGVMGVIELLGNTTLSSLCIERPKPVWPFEGKQQSICSRGNRGLQTSISIMASSTVPAAAVNEKDDGEQLECLSKVSGDSFIRSHLRKLKPYQPILPFEVTETLILIVLFRLLLYSSLSNSSIFFVVLLFYQYGNDKQLFETVLIETNA